MYYFAFILSLTWAFLVQATTLLDLELSDQAREAQWIGRVEITSIKTLSGEFPKTKLEGVILEVLKGRGSSGDLFTLKLPGGGGAKRVVVTGLPLFQKGNQYIFFLTTDPLSHKTENHLVGWTAYRVTENQQVLRVGGAHLVESTQTGYNYHSYRPPIRKYEEFVTEIFKVME